MRLRWALPVALTLSFSSLAQPPARTEAAAQSAIWVSPILFGVSLAEVLVSSAPAAASFPVGVSHSMSPHWNLVVEAAASWGSSSGPDSYQHRATQLVVAVGPEFNLGAEGQRDGMFVLPKIIAAYWWLDRTSQTGAPSLFTDAAELQLGVDLGYRISWGSFYFASFFGISGGYSTYASSAWAGPLLNTYERGSSRAVFALNLNFLRVGATF